MLRFCRCYLSFHILILFSVMLELPFFRIANRTTDGIYYSIYNQVFSAIVVKEEFPESESAIRLIKASSGIEKYFPIVSGTTTIAEHISLPSTGDLNDIQGGV